MTTYTAYRLCLPDLAYCDTRGSCEDFTCWSDDTRCYWPAGVVEGDRFGQTFFKGIRIRLWLVLVGLTSRAFHSSEYFGIESTYSALDLERLWGFKGRYRDRLSS